jgi:hypothetical protein
VIWSCDPRLRWVLLLDKAEATSFMIRVLGCETYEYSSCEGSLDEDFLA